MKKLFFKKILNGNNSYFGCDFGGSQIRLIQVENSRKKSEVIGWSQKKIPRGVVEHGIIKKTEDFIEIFREAYENVQGCFWGSDIKLTIPEEKIFTRVIEISLKEKDKKIEDLIKWETESSMPIAISEIYYDWQIIEKNQQTAKVLVMATEKKTVDNYLEVFDKLEFKTITIEPESLSMARSLIKPDTKGYFLIVDIGDNSSNFIICRDGLPIFTSSSSISGKTMTDLVVKELGFSFEKAERYKIKIGLEDYYAKNKKNKSIFNSVLISLINEIQKMSDFLDYNLFPGDEKKEIEKIILCGGGSNLKGLNSYLTVKIKKTVIQSNPWINFNFNNKIPPISKQDSQSFAPVIGLNLNFNKKEKNVNLISPERKNELKIKKINFFLIKNGLVLISGLIVFYFFMVANLFVLNIYNKISEVEVAGDEKNKMETTISKTKKQIDFKYSETEDFIKSFNQDQNYSKYFEEINKNLPEDVYFKKIIIEEGFLTVNGWSENRYSLINFEKYLKEKDLFENIETPISNLTSQENVNFEIVLKLKSKF
jgi:type IV pilus assembly protein PilM